MRQVVLDTETTGLDPKSGHKVIEIGCVELVNRKLTGRHYHQYINPMREVDQGAMEVHGITNEFLTDKPLFKTIVDDFMAFVEGAQLVIHNAPFDIGFLDAELKSVSPKLGKMIDRCEVLDTLVLARNKHPGQKNNLDALCKRYFIDNSQRDLHGALLDSEILADVYLAMTGGQTRLNLAADGADDGSGNHRSSLGPISKARAGMVLRATPEEIDLHEKKLETINAASSGECMWQKLH